MNARLLHVAGLAVLVAASSPALAQKNYGPGVTDTEIKVGNTMPYSGPASAYGAIGKAIVAYFQKVNDEGGINGRKVTVVSLDDGYSPPKAVEQVRRLVEQDQVLLVFQPLGTPSNTAIQPYLNENKVPQLFVATQTYETTDPTVDSQVVSLQSSGADTLLTAAIPKFAAQVIRKVYDIGWKPTHLLSNVSTSVKAALQPAGLDKSIGIISAGYGKEITDPKWQGTKEYKDWLAWMQKYNPQGNIADANNAYGYGVSQTLIAVLKACGNNLTRENVMKQAASIHHLDLPLLLPGIAVSTSPTDFAPIKQMQLEKFDGTTWEMFGPVISGAAS